MESSFATSTQTQSAQPWLRAGPSRIHNGLSRGFGTSDCGEPTWLTARGFGGSRRYRRMGVFHETFRRPNADNVKMSLSQCSQGGASHPSRTYRLDVVENPRGLSKSL